MKFEDALYEMNKGSICYKLNDPGLHFKIKDDGSDIIVMKRDDWSTWGDCCLSYADYTDEDWAVYDSKGKDYVGHIVECSFDQKLALVLDYKEDSNKYILLFEDGEVREYTCSKYISKISFGKDTMYRMVLKILKNRNKNKETFEDEMVESIDDVKIENCEMNESETENNIVEEIETIESDE